MNSCGQISDARLWSRFFEQLYLCKNRFQNFIKYLREMGDEVFGALAIAKLLSVPLVMSYHTHVPVYIPRYTFSWLVQPMWLVIKCLHRAADLTLVPSAAIAQDLVEAKATTGVLYILDKNQRLKKEEILDRRTLNRQHRKVEMV